MLIGAALTLASGLVGGREADGVPVSLRTWGLPLPWLKRIGPTQYAPAQPVKWALPCALLGFPLNTLFWSMAVFLLLRWSDQHKIARAEQRREQGLCSACGYNLTGNVSGACPECGERRC